MHFTVCGGEPGSGKQTLTFPVQNLTPLKIYDLLPSVIDKEEQRQRWLRLDSVI